MNHILCLYRLINSTNGKIYFADVDATKIEMPCVRERKIDYEWDIADEISSNSFPT